MASYDDIRNVRRDDVELYVSDFEGDRVGPVDKIEHYVSLDLVDDLEALREFLADGRAGEMMEYTGNGQLVLVLPGQGAKLGIEASVPKGPKPEKCTNCDAGADDIDWAGEDWQCQECGANMEDEEPESDEEDIDIREDSE